MPHLILWPKTLALNLESKPCHSFWTKLYKTARVPHLRLFVAQRYYKMKKMLMTNLPAENRLSLEHIFALKHFKWISSNVLQW